MKLGDDVAASGFEEEEQEALELFVSGFGGVQVGEDSVTAGELGGGHEGAGEDVTLFDFADVEKDREAFGVEQNDGQNVEDELALGQDKCFQIFELE